MAKHTLDLGPPSRGDASKSIPSARVSSALSSAMNRTLVPSGANWVFHALQHFINDRPLNEKYSDILEHKDIVHGNNIDIVNPFFFKLFVGAYVAGDLRSTRPGECARHANLNAVRLISLASDHRLSYKHVSSRELCDVKSLLWVVFLDCCASGEFAARLDFSVGDGCEVVRNRGEDGGHCQDGVDDVTNSPSPLYFNIPHVPMAAGEVEPSRS
jgi:hypothetical protein